MRNAYACSILVVKPEGQIFVPHSLERGRGAARSSQTPVIVIIYFEADRTLLTFYSLAVSLLTTRFNIQKFYMVLALR
jgi:hypothetical protein